MTLRRICTIVTASVVALVVGIIGMGWLIRLRQPLPRQIQPEQGKLVRVMRVQQQNVPLTIEGFGAVRAKTEWRVVSEVSGPVVDLSPFMRSGLHVKQGELLFEIDPRPYELAAQRSRAQIDRARHDIAVLRQQARNDEATLRIAERNLAIADAELKRDEALVLKGTISARERNQQRQLRNDVEQTVQTAKNSLRLIAPQIAKVEAEIAIQQVQLADAELQLEKTRFYAPVKAQIQNTHLDLGEYVQAGQEVATLYGTEAVEIPLALALDDLRWLSALSPDSLRDAISPGARPPTPLPPAVVQWHSGDRTYTWQGRVKRWEAGLDARTRTMTLVVEVRDPWQDFRPGLKPPLQPGMFCQVTITARHIPDAVVIPRVALRDENTVFLVQDGALVVRLVDVLAVKKDRVIITAGLQPGDHVIVSLLTSAVVGMKLRPREVEPDRLLGEPSADVSARHRERAVLAPDTALTWQMRQER